MNDELINLGFVYSKSKGIFVKPKNEFDQIISISPNSATIEYDEFKDEVQLHFRIISCIQIPKFEKWYDTAYGQKDRINHIINDFKYFCKLSDTELDILEIYTPTKSQLFKANVSRSISNSRRPKKNNFL
ncbi:MAG: hypothetical protein IPJ13_02235 [Saprospiraceae bacterium]|nr:hypothetical protein [Saprospiraceae bacterium]